MTTRMTPHGEQEIDDFYEAPEAPTPCINCHSPACEWPGRCGACERCGGPLAPSASDSSRRMTCLACHPEDALPRCGSCLDAGLKLDPEGLCSDCCKTRDNVRRLPIVTIEGTRYYRDDRLEEFRNVDDPHDRISFEFFDSSEDGLPGDPAPEPAAPLEAPEEILDILNDLIEWDAEMGCFENEVWDRARAIRDRLVVK